MDETLPNDDEKLIQYLEGMPEGPEKEAFEKELRSSPALAGRLENLRLSLDAVRHHGRRELVQGIHADMMAELRPGKRKLHHLFSARWVRYGISIAASVAIFFLLFRLFDGGPPSPGALYEEAYIDYTVSGPLGQDSLSLIEDLYQMNRFQAVVEASETFPLTRARDSLLTGLSFLKLNVLAPAMFYLEALSGAGSVQEDAQFYLALSYLKSGAFQKAYSLFKTINEKPGHVYRGRVTKEFLKEVKSLSQ
jgi:hypothetical protein